MPSKMSDTRLSSSPFDIRGQRAMVSLGPLSDGVHCAYNCPFCYVNNGFLHYASMSVDEIIQWLRSQIQNSFDIVYISGDTDSFAPPRTDKGMSLLERLIELYKDVLFTTRTCFNDYASERLSNIVRMYGKYNHHVFGCISIPQWTRPDFEPPPIPTPQQRINQLAKFNSIGIKSVLALRPFLPTIPKSDYISILGAAYKSVCLVLGERWFFDKHGIMESKLLKNANIPLSDYETNVSMRFDDNNEMWNLYKAPGIEELCAELCKNYGLPFSMSSKPALDKLRREWND